MRKHQRKAFYSIELDGNLTRVLGFHQSPLDLHSFPIMQQTAQSLAVWRHARYLPLDY